MSSPPVSDATSKGGFRYRSMSRKVGASFAIASLRWFRALPVTQCTDLLVNTGAMGYNKDTLWSPRYHATEQMRSR